MQIPMNLYLLQQETLDLVATGLESMIWKIKVNTFMLAMDKKLSTECGTQVNLMVTIGDVFLVIIMVELTLENGGTGLVAPHITLSVKHRTKEIHMIHRLFSLRISIHIDDCGKI